tara:strand:+ start:1388 stop:1927 length:540 start_codon:yes stop_codon:yes gene_type:complete
MAPAVDSVFDVAFWFSDQGVNNQEYIQPAKLHSLLFISQAYYATISDGEKLFPALFLAGESWPIEPSVEAAWFRGRPVFGEQKQFKSDTQTFLTSIWKRFGHHSTDYLVKMCSRSSAYKTAVKRGLRSEIFLKNMVDDFKKQEYTIDSIQFLDSRTARSHTGRTVTVKTWNPRNQRRKK